MKAAQPAPVKKSEGIVRKAAMVRLSDVMPEELVPLWYPYILRRKPNTLAGDAGLGKSFLTHALAAAVSNGHALPGEPGHGTGAQVREPESVVIASAEDGIGDTVAPRLIALGANMSKIHAITGVRVTTESGETHEQSLTLKHHLAQIEDAIRSLGDVALLVIDPLSGYIGADVEIAKSNESRPILSASGRLAEEHNLAVLFVMHLNRKTGDKANYRLAGSQEVYNASRSVLVVGVDPKDPNRRVLSHLKHNLTPEGQSRVFEIREGRFLWAGTSDLTAEQLMAQPATDEERSLREEAADWLHEQLQSGPMLTKDLKTAAARDGFSWRTIERAKTDLGIKGRRSGTHPSDPFEWILPEDSASTSAENVGGVAEYKSSHVPDDKIHSAKQSANKEYLAESSNGVQNGECVHSAYSANATTQKSQSEGRPPPEVQRLHLLWKAGIFSERPEHHELAAIFSKPKASASDQSRLLELANALTQVGA